jgi:hypothetical protein
MKWPSDGEKARVPRLKPPSLRKSRRDMFCMEKIVIEKLQIPHFLIKFSYAKKEPPSGVGRRSESESIFS